MMKKITVRLRLYWRSLDLKTIGVWTFFFLGINSVSAVFIVLYANEKPNLETEIITQEEDTIDTVDLDTIGTDPFIEVGLISNNQDRNESYYAITSEGYLYTWGWNLNGELGLGIEDPYVFYPTFVNLDGSFNDINNNGIKDNGEIATITDGDKVKQLYHINWDMINDAGIFAISQEGYLYMWGNSAILPEKNTDEYKYSSSKSINSTTDYISPTFVNLDNSYLQDDGSDVIVSARDIDGLLYKDSSNNIINVKVPTKTEGDKVADMEIYARSKSSYGGIILSDAGKLYGWGKNYSNTIDPNTSDTQIYDELTEVTYPTSDPYAGTTYKEVSVTNNGSSNIVTAIGDDGYLYMWGDTTLIPGISHSSTSTTPRVKIDLTDSSVSSDTTHSGKIKDLSMSRSYGALLLIDEDGYLYSIGRNSNQGTTGNSCNPPSDESEKFVIIDVNCDGAYNNDDKIDYISVTDYMVNAIAENGYFYTWGPDTGGSIGNGPGSNKESKPYRVDINQDSIYDSNDKVIKTDNGNPNLNGVITESSGDLYLWGKNDPGSMASTLPKTSDSALDSSPGIPTKANFVEYEEGEKFTTLNFWHSGGVVSTDYLSIYTWGNYDVLEERVSDNLRNVDKFTVDQFITPAVALK